MGIWLLLIISAAFLYFLERLSLKDPGDYLSIRYNFEKHLAEPDEELKLILTAENRRFLPVSFLDLRQSLPRDLTFVRAEDEGAVLIEYSIGNVLEDTLYLPRYRKLTRSYTLASSVRGYYRLNSISCMIGDFLGITNVPMPVSSQTEVVILPRRLNRPDISEITGGLMGDISVRRYILEDPVLTAGFRDYTGREPFRSISWSQSLRAGRLITKSFDHTAENSISVVLNLEGTDHDTAEYLLSLTRTVLEELTEHSFSWSFTSNISLFLLRGHFMRIPSGTGAKHLSGVLEALGKTDAAVRGSFQSMTENLIQSPVQAAGYLLITPEDTAEVRTQLRRLQARSSCPVRVLYASQEGGKRT